MFTGTITRTWPPSMCGIPSSLLCRRFEPSSSESLLATPDAAPYSAACASLGVAIAAHQVARLGHLDGERVVGARGVAHHAEPVIDRHLFGAEAQRARAPGL